MSLKQMQLLDGASAGKQEPVRIMGFDCVCGRRMVVSAEQGVVPAPQRTWQGLTDEEIDAVTDLQWAKGVNKPIYAAHRAYARAIEAKLKEKNGA